MNQIKKMTNGGLFRQIVLGLGVFAVAGVAMSAVPAMAHEEDNGRGRAPIEYRQDRDDQRTDRDDRRFDRDDRRFDRDDHRVDRDDHRFDRDDR